MSHHQLRKLAAGGRAEMLARKKDPKVLHEFIQKCQQKFMENGICHVPCFLGKTTVNSMLQEALSLADQGQVFYSTDSHTVYQEDQVSSLAPNHPRNMLQQSSKLIIDYARIPKRSFLFELYHAKELRHFIAAVVGEPILYPSGCLYNAAYYNIFEEGDGLGWHFDRSHFGVGIELQMAQQGGRFELCHKTRDPADMWSFENVLPHISPLGRKGQVLTNVGPGSLVIFEGRMSLHRVTPVKGSVARVNAIMTYESKPNSKPNSYSLKKFFGRDDGMK